MSQSETGVLVVDDERFFRRSIREVLEGRGIRCRECVDGGRALELAADPSVGVVLLAIRLEGGDGVEILRSLRALRPALRVIMLCSPKEQERVLDALREGACDYLAKPLHDEELVLAVTRAMESHAVASDWGRLRGRLDSLVSQVEELAKRASGLDGDERESLLREGAALAAARVLGARRTSLMLVDEEGRALRVEAAVGHPVEAGRIAPTLLGEGVAGAALERGEAMVVRDVRDDDRVPSSAPEGRYTSNSFAVAPLEIGDRRLGVLCATEREDGGGFGEEDLALLRVLAVQTSELLGVGRRRGGGPREPVLEPDPAADRDSELARVVCDAVVSEVEPERVIRAVLEPLSRALPAAPVSLYLLDGVTGELACEGECDGGSRSDRPRLPVGSGLTGAVVQTGHLVATREPEADPRFDSALDTPEDGRSGPMLCLPLHLRGKVVGIFRAFLEDGVEPSARTGEVLAAALSAAVRNVLLYRSLVETIEEVAAVRREARGEVPTYPPAPVDLAHGARTHETTRE